MDRLKLSHSISVVYVIPPSAKEELEKVASESDMRVCPWSTKGLHRTSISTILAPYKISKYPFYLLIVFCITVC